MGKNKFHDFRPPLEKILPTRMVAPGTSFASWSKHHFFVIGRAEQQLLKASHCGSKQQQGSHVVLILFLLIRTLCIWVLLFTHIPFVVKRPFNTALTQRLQHLQQGWPRPGLCNCFAIAGRIMFTFRNYVVTSFAQNTI